MGRYKPKQIILFYKLVNPLESQTVLEDIFTDIVSKVIKEKARTSVQLPSYTITGMSM